MDFAQAIYIPAQPYYPTTNTFDPYSPTGAPRDAQYWGQYTYTTGYALPSDVPLSPTIPKRNNLNNIYSYPTSIHDPSRMVSNRNYPAVPRALDEVPRSSTRRRSNTASSTGFSQTRTLSKSAQDERTKRCPDASPSSSHQRLTGPSNHVYIPQGAPSEPASSKDCRSNYQPISFQRLEFPEAGIKVGCLLSPNKPPAIQGGDDQVFREVTEREIKIQIIWPGYSAHKYEKRVKTKNGELSRSVLLWWLGQIVVGLPDFLKSKPVEKGMERWSIRPKAQLGPFDIDLETLFITQLVHCNGSLWQMELWAPKNSVPVY